MGLFGKTKYDTQFSWLILHEVTIYLYTMQKFLK